MDSVRGDDRPDIPEDAAEAPKISYDVVAPDNEYFDLLIQSLQIEFERRDQRDELREQAYWGTNPIPHPAHVDFQPIHMGLPTEVVERVRGILDDFPRCSISTLDIDTLQVKRAQRVEDFTNAIFPAVMDESDDDTWDYVIEDITRYGRGYDELLYLPERRASTSEGFPVQSADEAAEKYLRRRREWELKAKLPISWRHLPARSTFLWYDDEGAYEGITVELRRAREVASKYDLAADLRRSLDNRSMSPFDLIYFVRYWSKNYGAYWVSQAPRETTQGIVRGVDAIRTSRGEVVKVFPNIYGRVPITETSGITTSDPRSERKQLAIFDHMLDLSFSLDQLVSQKATAVRQWAWATPILENTNVRGDIVGQTPLPPDKRPAPLDIEVGKLNVFLPGEKLGWMIAPGDGAGSGELLRTIRSQVDLLGITSAVFSGEALGSNGYLYNSIMNAIRSKYSGIIRHVKRSHKHRVQQLFRIVEVHGEPLFVQKTSGQESEWIKLDPSDLKDVRYNIEVSFEDHLPTDDAADMSLALQSSGGEFPLTDLNSAREKYLHDKDPERTEERILAQKFKQRPEIDNFLIARAVKKAGLILDQKDQGQTSITPEMLAQLPPALQQALMQAGAVPGAAPMPGGPGAAPGMGMPMPMGMPPGMPMGMPPGPAPGPAVMTPLGPNGAAQSPQLNQPLAVTGQPYLPGLSKPFMPPQPVARRHNRQLPAPGGRPAGQSKKPPTQPKAGKP